jgi:predicted small lipoprotein YifL
MKNKLGVLMIVAILATTYACGSKGSNESASATDTTKVATDSAAVKDTTNVKADTAKAK